MSNPYRLRSSDLFKRLDDDSKEMPLRIVFLSVEGNATEVDYFKHVEEFSAFTASQKSIKPRSAGKLTAQNGEHYSKSLGF